jgi:intergrase/recombinase
MFRNRLKLARNKNLNYGAPAGIRTRVFGSKGACCIETAVRLDWTSMRDGFIAYLNAQNYSDGYKRDVLGYLDRCVTSIKGPSDVISLFNGVERGRRHLWLAMRVLFNYAEALGLDPDGLDVLRKALPKGANSTNPDLKVPDGKAVQNSPSSLSNAPQKYQVLYNVLLDSGLRLVEAVSIINNFRVEDVERVGRFYRVEIGAFRGSKQAFYGYFTEYTFKAISEAPIERLGAVAASRYFTKMGYTRPKYLRKFCFDKMLELGVPESIADFVQGRVATRIGARHYCALRRQADKAYPKYARYLM